MFINISRISASIVLPENRSLGKLHLFSIRTETNRKYKCAILTRRYPGQQEGGKKATERLYIHNTIGDVAQTNSSR